MVIVEVTILLDRVAFNSDETIRQITVSGCVGEANVAWLLGRVSQSLDACDDELVSALALGRP